MLHIHVRTLDVKDHITMFVTFYDFSFPLKSKLVRMNCSLALSTATPSIGGSAPTLETCRLSLIPNVYPGRGRSGSFKYIQ